MTLLGVDPMTANPSRSRSVAYRQWLEALDAAARESAKSARAVPPGTRFALRLDLRLCAHKAMSSDLDNFVKPIQDSLAAHGVFGPTAFPGSTRAGDEHVDHLDIRRALVPVPNEAGVVADIWALSTPAI